MPRRLGRPRLQQVRALSQHHCLRALLTLLTILTHATLSARRNLLPSCMLGDNNLPYTAEGISMASIPVTFDQEDIASSDLPPYAEQGPVRSVDLLAPITCQCARELAWFWRADSGRAWLCFDVDASLDDVFDDPSKYSGHARAIVMQEGFPVVDLPDRSLAAFKHRLLQFAPMSECKRANSNRCGLTGTHCYSTPR